MRVIEFDTALDEKSFFLIQGRLSCYFQRVQKKGRQKEAEEEAGKKSKQRELLPSQMLTFSTGGKIIVG